MLRRLAHLAGLRRVSDIVRPPRVAWPESGVRPRWRDRRRPCPNCGSVAEKPHVLRVFAASPGHPERRRDVLRCPDCTARFMNTLATPDYADEDMLRRGRVAFYVQQGAGVSLITRPLTLVSRPPGSTYMEVGCGYGFGLDFAVRAKGWQGRGIDPARLSALGRDALDVPIELRYLRDDDEARGSMDVVLASEVIEHVVSPRAFVRTLRAMLRPGGTLLLTTPNGQDLTPQTPPGALVPLLSPGLHLVIQTPRSLRRLLLEAGFAHAKVMTDSHAIIAVASDAPLRLEADQAAMRYAYRSHLQTRAATLDPASDAFLGYAGRAFQEAVNDGELAAAERSWALLVPACLARFGLDLDRLAALPPEAAACSLERMAELMPLALGGLLFADAMRRLQSGETRAALADRLGLAAEAADALRRALGELAMEDGHTEDLGWASRAELVLCAAEMGAPDLLAQAAALPPAPAHDATRRRDVMGRLLGTLVNAGSLELADRFAAAENLARTTFAAPLTPAQRDLLFALAMLDVQPGASAFRRARTRFSAVRAATEAGGGLAWAAVRGEALALDRMGQPRRAAALLRGAALHGSPADMAGQLGDAAAMLADLPTEAELVAAAQAGDAWSTEELGGLPPGPERDRLFAGTLTLLVNAGNLGAARAVADAGGLWDAAIDAASPLGRDAAFCLGVLDAGIDSFGRPLGDPARARSRFVQARDGSEPGNELYWAALRGELQALDLLGARDEAAELVGAVAASGVARVPADILARRRPLAAGV